MLHTVIPPLKGSGGSESTQRNTISSSSQYVKKNLTEKHFLPNSDQLYICTRGSFWEVSNAENMLEILCGADCGHDRARQNATLPLRFILAIPFPFPETPVQEKQ